MPKQPSSYLSSRLKGRLKATGDGNGIYTLQPINKGDLLALFGGVIYEWEAFIHLPERERSLGIQVEERHFLVPRPIGEGDYVNHSCNPNAGLSGQIGPRCHARHQNRRRSLFRLCHERHPPLR